MRRRLTQALESERRSSSPPQFIRVSHSYECGVFRPSIPFRRVSRCPNLLLEVNREPASNHVFPDIPSPSIPPQDPQTSSPDSPQEISNGSSVTPHQHRSRLFSSSGCPPNCFPLLNIASSSEVDTSESPSHALSSSLNEMLIDDILELGRCHASASDATINESISLGGENKYGFGDLFDTLIQPH